MSVLSASHTVPFAVHLSTCLTLRFEPSLSLLRRTIPTEVSGLPILIALYLCTSQIVGVLLLSIVVRMTPLSRSASALVASSVLGFDGFGRFCLQRYVKVTEVTLLLADAFAVLC